MTPLVVLQEVDRLGPDGAWVRETEFNDGKGWDGEDTSGPERVQYFHTPPWYSAGSGAIAIITIGSGTKLLRPGGRS
jgi:hypothetical protein